MGPVDFDCRPCLQNHKLTTCKVCFENYATVVALRCGHVCWCANCGQQALKQSGGVCAICGAHPATLPHEGKPVALCDIRNSLREKGQPQMCYTCIERPAKMLLLPCLHCTHCDVCFRKSGARGCPTCGTLIKHKCEISWPDGIMQIINNPALAEDTTCINVKQPPLDGCVR